jgi:hypothetical protein
MVFTENNEFTAQICHLFYGSNFKFWLLMTLQIKLVHKPLIYDHYSCHWWFINLTLVLNFQYHIN